jgi:hypothetical protein
MNTQIPHIYTCEFLFSFPLEVEIEIEIERNLWLLGTQIWVRIRIQGVPLLTYFLRPLKNLVPSLLYVPILVFER